MVNDFLDLNYTEDDEDENNDDIDILDLFMPYEVTETTNGYKMECPCCGLQGGRTEGFIISRDKKIGYCHSSNRWFKLLEVYALKKGLIKCMDGREKDDSKTKILGGELWTLTLEEFKNEFGEDKYNKLSEQLKIKKRIEIPGNDSLISNFATNLGEIYKSRNILFKRAETNDVVKINRTVSIGEDGKEYFERGIKKIQPEEFVSLAELLITPWSRLYTKKGEMIVNKSMTQTHANLTLNSDNFKNKLPILHRFFDIQIPILYKGKLTFPKRGYDKRFGTWLSYDAPLIDVDAYETVDDAMNVINYIFKEFCFESEKDKTHAIAAFITPFCRGLFGDFSTRTPVFIYLANRERAGKDYCANCTGILYEGVAIEMPPISNDEDRSSNNEEIRKKLMSCMIEGKKRFHSSNNKGYLNNSVFESVTTSKIWTDRVLGKSKTVTYDNEMDYSLSGNIGIRLTPDLSNRSRMIKLHLVDEDANARVFENPDLHGWVKENRVAIISAIYKIIEYWFQLGCPPSSQPFTSFPKWAEVVGGIMETVNYGNPCLKEENPIMTLNPETDNMKQLFERCYEKYPNQPIDNKTIQSEATEIYDYDFDKKSDITKFGMELNKYVNRILSGIFLQVNDIKFRARDRKYYFVKQDDNLRSPCTYVHLSPIIDDTLKGIYSNREIVSIGARCPLPKTPENDIFPQNNQNNQNIVTKNTLSQDVVTKTKEITERSKLKHQKHLKSKEKPQKVKTERELQWFEDPQCDSVIQQCSKEQVLEWIKSNPDKNYKDIDTLGLGCFKHIIDLVKEGKIEKVGLNWRIKNV